jgi:Ca-activated chloride channel family protein
VAEVAVIGLTWAHAERIHLIWLALAFTGLLAWLELHGRARLGGFVSRVMAGRLATAPSLELRMTRIGLIFATLLLGIFALMQPQSRGQTERVAASRVSADIVVALDVSRSMLAEDAPPNRLARARAEIRELVGSMRGHRFGLVAFAGRAAQVSPLTPDYAFFRMALDGVDTNSVGLGGTRIGEAIRTSIDAFGSGTGSRIILLITDGEDHDSYPREAAKEAAKAGVRIIAIGFGSEEGSTITITNDETGAPEPLIDPATGKPVISRLDGELLRDLALETEGAYVPAGTAALDLESIVEEHLEPIVRADADTAGRVIPREQYPWFVLGALLCLIGAVVLGGASGRRPA